MSVDPPTSLVAPTVAPRTGGRVRSPSDLAHWAERHASGLVFAGPDPHYGIGLEALIPGYRIVSIDAPPALDILRARGVDVFALSTAADVAPTAGADGERSTSDLLASPQTATFLNRRSAAAPEAVAGDPIEGGPVHLLVFKSSHSVETLCREHGWTLLCAPAKLARHWENKVIFRRLADELGLPQPPGMAVDLGEARYADIATTLGPRFVLQAAHGYSGARSFDIADLEAFRAAVAALRGRTVRATTFVPGLPLTLNACVTARGVAVGAPFLQVTGDPGLTRYPLGACGNDWSAAAEMNLDPVPFVAIAQTVGRAMAKQGYRGIFGLDFVLAEDQSLVVIEVNPRLVASIALYTQLELLAGRLPLLARHILAFVDPDADAAPLDAHLEAVAGAQVILHNLAPEARRVHGSLLTGVYRWLEMAAELALMRPAVRVDAIEVPGEMLALAPARGGRVSGGQAWGRIQVRRRVLGSDGRLAPEIARAIQAFGEAVDLRPMAGSG